MKIHSRYFNLLVISALFLGGCNFMEVVENDLQSLKSFANRGEKTVDKSDHFEQNNGSSDKELISKIYQIGEQAKLNNDVITVNKVSECFDEKSYTKPAEGMKFISVDVRQNYEGKGSATYNSLSFKLKDNEDFVYSDNFKTCDTPRLNSGKIQHGNNVRGYLNFEIPAANSPTMLIFESSVMADQQLLIDLVGEAGEEEGVGDIEA